VFRQTLALNGLTRVEPIQADVKTFLFDQLTDISFCLVDVDLYQPVREALARVWPRVAPGGVVVVDDCGGDAKWDGSLQAYSEFVAEHCLPPEIVLTKLGVLRKP
jgi:O-methyltransferase